MLPPGTVMVRALRRPAESTAAVDVLTDAFLDFPAMRVLVGDDAGARGRLRRLFAMELDAASRLTAIGAEIEGELAGVLTSVDSPGCLSRSAGQVVAFMRIAGPRVVRAMHLFGRIERSHPRAPHRHLPSVGVVPAHQRKGVGLALMDAFHERCDADGSMAYLETIRWTDFAKPSHERFYRRLGYVVTDVVPMTDEWEVLTMSRPARRRPPG